jgi:hypothetical protein
MIADEVFKLLHCFHQEVFKEWAKWPQCDFRLISNLIKI